MLLRTLAKRPTWLFAKKNMSDSAEVPINAQASTKHAVSEKKILQTSNNTLWKRTNKQVGPTFILN